MTNNFRRYMFFAAAFLLVIFTCEKSAQGQKKGEIVSGNYESLLLGVDSEGGLTGYFTEGTGDDGEGNPRFTCTFFISGEKQADGQYLVTTWFPEYPEDVVEGKLNYFEKDGKKGVNLQLKGEHGGCWNVAPVLREEGGLDFDLDSTGNWNSIRMVSSERVYLFKSAEAKAPQKIYIVKNDVVRVLQAKGDFVEISFTSNNGRTTKGWMKPFDFYPLAPDK